jgi:hypothetical protein
MTGEPTGPSTKGRERSSVVSVQIRNPEYTGGNRCWPCTLGNVLVVGLVAGLAALLAPPAVPALVGGVGLLAVGLRGYAVPGTPRLMQAIPRRRPGRTDDASADLLDALEAAGILSESGLRPGFERRYRELVSEALSDDEAARVALESNVPEIADVSVTRALGGGQHWSAFADDGTTVAEWNDRTVAAMDAAGAELLSDGLADWAERSTRDRLDGLAVLRVAASECPACGGRVETRDRESVACCGGRRLAGLIECPTCRTTVVETSDVGPSVRRLLATTSEGGGGTDAGRSGDERRRSDAERESVLSDDAARLVGGTPPVESEASEESGPSTTDEGAVATRVRTRLDLSREQWTVLVSVVLALPYPFFAYLFVTGASDPLLFAVATIAYSVLAMYLNGRL